MRVSIPFLFLLSCLPLAAAEDPEWMAVVASRCLECHDGDVEKGGVNIEAMLDAGIDGDPGGWERVLRQVVARQMPPLGEERPSPAEYERVETELTAALDARAVDHPAPGRTPSLRRLTRTEYGHAIRDLLALEVDVTELLPADPSSHGFDNITVGDLSPTLLDRYLAASQKISRLAVGRSTGRLEGRTVRPKPDLTQEHHVAGLPLGTRGGLLIRHEFPRDGTYEVQVRLTRDRNEHVEGLHGTHRMEVLLDGELQKHFRIRPPEDPRDHTKVDAGLVARFPVEAGPRDLGVTFVQGASSVDETLRQPYQSRFNVHRHPRRSPAIYEVSILGPFEDEGISETPSRERIFRTRPDSPEDAGESADEILSRLLGQAWRRAVGDEDLARIRPFFEEVYAETGDFEGGIESALSAILVSREFLFRLEKDPADADPGAAYALSPRELATRLSFFLWSSLPDEELLARAEDGSLASPSELERQARRLLADPRSRSLVTSFADQWLQLRNLDAVTPDGRLFPDFDENLRVAFRRETEHLFERVLREDRSVLDLVSTDVAFLNERLAAHYGIPHVVGPRFREVELDPESRRGGLLRNGSVLAVTSYATRTSPVIRGNWVLENLLGTPPPPPPPNVPALEEASVSEDLPIRERLAAHREQAACASCHRVIDPVGFALEHYDAIGRWRELDGENPVDARGGLPDGTEFVGVEGLEQSILDRPEGFVGTLAEKLLTYALGRGVEPTDGPALRKIVREAEAEDYRFSELVVALVRSVPFTMRKTASGEGEPAERVH